MRMLMGKQKDIRQMVIYGYARLVGYTADLELKPDLLESLRSGRWAGFHAAPAQGSSLVGRASRLPARIFVIIGKTWRTMTLTYTRAGPPRALMVSMVKLPTSRISRTSYTVRYSWHAPNPYFLDLTGQPRTFVDIYKPAHYLRQFHPRYQSADVLKEKIDQG